MNFDEFDTMVTTAEQDLADYKPVTNHDTPEYPNGVSPELKSLLLSLSDTHKMQAAVDSILDEMDD